MAGGPLASLPALASALLAGVGANGAKVLIASAAVTSGVAIAPPSEPPPVLAAYVDDSPDYDLLIAADPTATPTATPTTQPTATPTTQPTATPTTQPTATPTTQPTATPTAQPTAPIPAPTLQPFSPPPATPRPSPPTLLPPIPTPQTHTHPNHPPNARTRHNRFAPRRHTNAHPHRHTTTAGHRHPDTHPHHHPNTNTDAAGHPNTNTLAHGPHVLPAQFPRTAGGDTSSQDLLPLDTTVPTAATLFNYDIDRDTQAGLLSFKGDGLIDKDPSKYQRWQHNPDASLDLDGFARLNVWTAMKDFTPGKQGAVLAGLYDCKPTGDSCVLITSGGVILSQWPETWREIAVDLGAITHKITSDRSLVLHLATLDTSDDDLWVAYDTTTHLSNLSITVAVPTPTPTPTAGPTPTPAATPTPVPVRHYGVSQCLGRRLHHCRGR